MTLEEVTILKEAIKRLKEVIKEVRSTIQPFLYDNEAIDYIIKALEQPKWIPVSERLPEDRKEKLVYLSSNRITIAKYSSRIIPLAPYKSMGWGYEPKYHFIDFETEEVIAWMPLPDPYKAESEG